MPGDFVAVRVMLIVQMDMERVHVDLVVPGGGQVQWTVLDEL